MKKKTTKTMMICNSKEAVQLTVELTIHISKYDYDIINAYNKW